MKRRNPLFVAGFPYAMLLISYFVLNLLFQTSIEEDAATIPTSALFPFFGALAIMLVGAGYTLYWLISTARGLRRETGQKIPPAILLIIPFANYWWFWRYSAAAEAYTRGKAQAALGFLVLVLLGPIGAGILQDYYNKTAAAPSGPAQ